MLGRKMTAALAHRGPDGSGLWQDPDAPLLLGHQRLAIIDLTPEGHQPMVSASGRFVIAYNGEIYNFPALQREMEGAGVKFRGRSDTEVILAAIEHWGLNLALQKINGMFAFALWDRNEQKIHFIRDRMGKKPLYIGWAGQSLVFGSELKSLHEHPDFFPAISRDVLALYMQRGFVPAPHSIYEGVWSLPAGYRLMIDTRALHGPADLSAMMEPYWHPLRVIEDVRDTRAHKDEASAVAEFESLLADCVRERMISDVPLGAFLSGGVDSSAVVALMQKVSSNPVKTYSIGFKETGFDEAAHAAKVAAHLGTDHHELYLDAQNALDIIPELPTIYDEPFADISAIPTYMVAKFARHDVTVALTGDGGDEMLGGYNRHIMAPKIAGRMRAMPRPVRRAMASAIGLIPTRRWDSLARALPQMGSAMHKTASILSLESQEEIYNRLISQWPDPPVLNAAHLRTLQETPDYRPQNLSFAEEMMYWDTLTYLPYDILTKVDRASMAVGLEARAPLLDARIYKYTWSLPESFKIRGSTGKWLLREMLARHLPRPLFERPKQGFAMPVGDWLRGPLKDWAAALLDEKRLNEQGLLNAPVIRDAWDAHLKGRGNLGGRLWTVLMFQAWQEKWSR